MSRFKKIVIKVGTNVLTKTDGLLDMTTISHLVDQIAVIKKQGIEVILVSSGAVGAGKSMIKVSEHLNKIVQRQVFSAIGQVRLVNIYMQFFSNYDLYGAQVLATKEDFRDRVHYLNMKNCFQALLRDNIIPIVNENDVIAVSELMFTDNDELAGLVAAMTNADALIILSNVDGVLNGSPEHPDSQVIPEIAADDKKVLNLIAPVRSSFGRGGMSTKLRIAQKAAKVGITTIIAKGKRFNILLDIVKGDFVGTTFKAQPVLSNVKKWIAYNHTGKKGKVYINKGAENALCSTEKVSSLLPVGITKIEGDFKKGDILQILNESEQIIGLGIAQYPAKTAQQYIGQKDKKPLIHYDYLLVEEQ